MHNCNSPRQERSGVCPPDLTWGSAAHRAGWWARCGKVLDLTRTRLVLVACRLSLLRCPETEFGMHVRLCHAPSSRL